MHHKIFGNDKTFSDYSESKFREGYESFWNEKDHTDNPYCTRDGFYYDIKRPDDEECYYVADLWWFKGWRFADLEVSESSALLSDYQNWINSGNKIGNFHVRGNLELHKIVRNWIKLGCYV